MSGSRTVTALVGIVLSLVITAILWWQFDSLLFFLFIPFVPFLFRGFGSTDTNQPEPRRCPQCGFQTTDEEYEFCPRDGRRLDTTSQSWEDDGDRW